MLVLDLYWNQLMGTGYIVMKKRGRGRCVYTCVCTYFLSEHVLKLVNLLTIYTLWLSNSPTFLMLRYTEVKLTEINY